MANLSLAVYYNYCPLAVGYKSSSISLLPFNTIFSSYHRRSSYGANTSGKAAFEGKIPSHSMQITNFLLGSNDFGQ